MELLDKPGLKHTNCKYCDAELKPPTWNVDSRKKKGGFWKQDPFCYTCANLWKLYKIRVPEYNKMFADQGGVCAICNQSSEKTLHVDHCHTTGEIRGLLCTNCNNGIGRFQDNIEFLTNAINYLSTKV